MKVRAQRTHYMGNSNRDMEKFNITTNEKNQSVFQRSFNKSKSLYTHHQQNQVKQNGLDKTTDGRINPFLGTHNQFETSRFDKNQIRPYKYSKMVFPLGRKSITFASNLNKQVKIIQQQFNGRKINMHKLKQLKHSFVKKNRDKRNLLPYFQNYAKNGLIDINGLRNIVKEYGFDISDDQAQLLFKLTHHSNKQSKSKGTNSLNIDDFVHLMTKDDVYYQTLQIDIQKDATGSFSARNFSDKVYQILRNKFPNLKQAFKIYRQRGQQIGLKQFEYVMKKLDLTDLVMNQEERMKIYQDFSDKNGSFNVEGLICAIAAQQHSIKNEKIQQNDFTQDLQANKQIEFSRSGRARHYNMKNLSAYEYENQYSKARTVIQQLLKLRNKKKEQRQDLDIFKNYFKDNYLNRQLVIKATQKMLQKEGINFHKEDYEAFAAYLNYDVQGNISLQKINHEVFFETQKQAKDRIERRVRNLQPKKVHNIQSQHDFDSSSAIQAINKLKSHRMNPQTRQLFKFFDKDQDGYIHQTQFKQKMDSLKIMQNWQIQNLAKYLKLNGTGSINFRDFSKKINEDLKVLQQQLPLVKSRNSKSCYDWAQTTKNRNNLIKTFNQSGYQKPTKFSAWPQNLITQDLSLIQPKPFAGMYISQAERFSQKKQDYGRNQKMKALALAQNRRQKIVEWNNTLQQRIQINREKQQDREAAKNYSLRLTKQKYEFNCHHL